MSFFKKIFPKPKDVIKSPVTLIKASPKEKIQDFLAGPKALIHGDIGGALNYSARAGGSLVDKNNAAMAEATAQRRADAAQQQFNFYSQAPMTQPQNAAPIIPPSYGQLDDYLRRINGGPSAYAPPPVPTPMQAPQPGGNPFLPNPQFPQMPAQGYPFIPLNQRAF